MIDTDDPQLIDAGVLAMWLGMTASGVRKWVRRMDVHRVRKGAHGRSLYRLADVQSALDNARRDPVPSDM